MHGAYRSARDAQGHLKTGAQRLEALRSQLALPRQVPQQAIGGDARPPDCIHCAGEIAACPMHTADFRACPHWF